MRYRTLSSILITLTALFSLWAVQASAQDMTPLEEGRMIVDLLPDFLEGFETDEPMIITQSFQSDRNLTVKQIYYRTDGSEHITIEVNDYGVNDKLFEQQYQSLKTVVDTVANNPEQYRFEGYLKQKQVTDQFIKMAIYMRSKHVVTVTHEGFISDSTLHSSLLRAIDLERINRIYH